MFNFKEPILENTKALNLIEHIEGKGLIAPSNKGLLVKGNNLDVMVSLLSEYKGKIDLIYIDPPYLTGLDFKTKDGNFAYTDKFTKEGYLQFVYERLYTMKELLSDTGSIYVHVDYRTSHYIKLILDDIFGEDNFRNEIIWHYQSGGRQKNTFSKKHDTIFYYSKSDKWIFNIHDVGIERGANKRNNMKREIDENGKVYFTIKSANKIYKYYEDEKLTPPDVWCDISHLQQKHPERLGYPTQKPEALLERIIKASSNEGDLVADFFAGSGTTLAVSQKLNRNWIGVDLGDESIKTIKERMINLDATFDIKERMVNLDATFDI